MSQGRCKLLRPISRPCRLSCALVNEWTSTGYLRSTERPRSHWKKTTEELPDHCSRCSLSGFAREQSSSLDPGDCTRSGISTPFQEALRPALQPQSRTDPLLLRRLQLPELLPPSFRGSAVRYTYQLEAKAFFAPQSWAGTPMSTPRSVDSKTQTPLPLPETPAYQQAEASASHSHPPLPNYGSRSSLKGSAREAGQQRRRGPGVVHVKAPIHIWPLVRPLHICSASVACMQTQKQGIAAP